MKGLLTCMLIVSMPVSVWCQSFDKLAELPSALSESSGIEVINNNLFVTHNDGGDEPRLYFIDSSGVLQREVFVSNAKNTDWEDVTITADGKVFVGNFGNNGHNRKDLVIYVLPDYKTWTSDTVQAEVIEFNYGDQSAYPPIANNRVFDCEALAFYNDSLYLFSKNWSSPFTGMTKMYVLAAKPGSYTIYPTDSVNLGSIKEIAWVTGADITDSALYLLGSAFVWKFNHKGQINLSNPVQIALNHFSQKEAIAINANALYITDESAGGFGNLYRYSVAATMAAQPLQTKKPYVIVQGTNSCILENQSGQNLDLRLYDLTGRQVGGQLSSTARHIDIQNNFTSSIISGGVYWLHIQCNGSSMSWEKVLIGK